MKLAYIPNSARSYRELTNEDVLDSRRLAALVPTWSAHGIEVVPWQPGIVCDVIYIVNLASSLDIAETVLRQEHKNCAVVVGIVEDVGTAPWASVADENIDNWEKLAQAWVLREKTIRGRLREFRDRFARLGVATTQTTRLRRAVSQCDGVICTSESQAAALRYLNPLCMGIIDCIPLADYQERNRTIAEELLRLKRSDNSVLLVWEGTAWGMQLLELIRKPIEWVAARANRPVKLVVIVPKNRPTSLFGSTDNEKILSERYAIPTRWLNWDLNTVGAILRVCDIGLAPMPTRNPFYRAKAFNKPLVYMTLGLPVVASNIPSYAQLIQHGVNGFLACSEEDWCRNLEILIADEDLRKRIGSAGLRRAQEFHSVENVAREFAAVFRDALSLWKVWQTAPGTRKNWA